MLPLYVWITVFVGRYHDKQWNDYLGEIFIISPLVVLGAIALIQLLALSLFRTTASHATFRLAVVNAKGEPANRVTLLRRWAIVWLGLFVPMSFVALLIKRAEGIAFICALVLLVLWTSAAVYAAIVPNRGLHDRLAGTWVVRR